MATTTYTILSTTGGGIGSGATVTESTTVDEEPNKGNKRRYALRVRGDIASADLTLQITDANANSYDTPFSKTGLDLTDGGEVFDVENEGILAVIQVAADVEASVTNNDASAGDATVELVRYQER